MYKPKNFRIYDRFGEEQLDASLSLPIHVAGRIATQDCNIIATSFCLYLLLTMVLH